MARGADADVRNAVLQICESRQQPVDQFRRLEPPVGHAGSDCEEPVPFCQDLELGDPLQVDELGITGEAELHHEEQLGTTAIDRGVVSELLEDRMRLFERRRPVKLERRQPHATGAASLARTSSAASTPAPIST